MDPQQNFPEISSTTATVPADIGPTDVTELVHLFLQLRGRGSSLSPADLQVAESWQSLNATFIAQAMWAVSAACEKKSKPFPKSLRALNRRLARYLRQTEGVCSA